MNNLRRFPSDTSDLKNNKYMDILYGTLQMLSEWDEEQDTRFVRIKGPKKVTKTQLSNFSNMSRPTVDSHLKKLAEGNYIKIEEEKIILPKVGKYYFLIPYETLRYMSNTFKPNVIKVYTYLGRMWEYYVKDKKGSQLVIFTENVLLEEIGYNPTVPENHIMIRDILMNLTNNGLIYFSKSFTKMGNEVYILNKMYTTPIGIDGKEKPKEE